MTTEGPPKRADGDDKKAQALLQKLKDSGEYQKLHEKCLEKLLQSNGWKENLEDLAKETVREQPHSLEDLVTKLVPAGKSSIPPHVSQELRELVRDSMTRLQS